MITDLDDRGQDLSVITFSVRCCLSLADVAKQQMTTVHTDNCTVMTVCTPGCRSVLCIILTQHPVCCCGRLGSCGLRRQRTAPEQQKHLSPGTNQCAQRFIPPSPRLQTCWQPPTSATLTMPNSQCTLQADVELMQSWQLSGMP